MTSTGGVGIEFLDCHFSDFLQSLGASAFEELDALSLG